MFRVLNMPGFWIFVNFRKYDKILNMCQDAIMEGFWIFKDSEYASLLLMQAFRKVLNMPEYGWIMTYGRVLNMPGQFRASGSKYDSAQNMAKLLICEDYTGCWIYLNKPEYALIMSQYAWICLNNTEYDWICQHKPENMECWICQNSECAWCSA